MGHRLARLRLRRFHVCVSLLPSFALLGALAGCDSEDTSKQRTDGDASTADGGIGGSGGVGNDAATDASTDAASDAAADASTDAASDAATDASTDANSDAATDASTDANSDAAADASDLCQGVVCVASDACHLVGTCDPQTGQCSDPPATDGALCPCGECINAVCGLRALGTTSLDSQTGTPSPISFAVDPTRVYFGSSYDGFSNQAGVGAISTMGGSTTTLAGGFTGYPLVAVAQGTVYYARSAEVWRVTGDGSGSPTMVYTDSAAISDIATDAARIYLISGSDVSSLPFGGGTPTPLATGEAGPAALIVRGGRLYWVNAGDLTIRSVLVGGGAVTTIVTAAAAPAKIDVDANNVYWTEPSTSTVQHAPLGGGAATPLATAQVDPLAINVVNGVVYWTNYNAGSQGSVMSVPVTGGTPVQGPGSTVHAPLSLGYNGSCMFLMSTGNGTVWSFPER